MSEGSVPSRSQKDILEVRKTSKWSILYSFRSLNSREYEEFFSKFGKENEGLPPRWEQDLIWNLN